MPIELKPGLLLLIPFLLLMAARDNMYAEQEKEIKYLRIENEMIRCL
jgi:hypothetical protein